MLSTRFLIICVVCISPLIRVNAQSTFRFGPQVGANISSVSYQQEPNHNGTLVTGYRAGFSAGLVGLWSVTHQLSIQPGARFIRSSFSTSETAVSVTSTTISNNYYKNSYLLNKLEIPINLLYFINKTARSPYLLAGISTGILLGGSRSFDSRFVENGNTNTYSGKDDILVGSTYSINTSNYYMRRWDLGVQAGLGYQFNCIAIQAAYRVGVVNTATKPALNLPSPTTYSRFAEIQASYYLR